MKKIIVGIAIFGALTASTFAETSQNSSKVTILSQAQGGKI